MIKNLSISIVVLLFLISCGGGSGSSDSGGVIPPPVQSVPPQISTLAFSSTSVYTVDDLTVNVTLSSSGGSASFTFNWTVNGVAVISNSNTLSSNFYKAKDNVKVEVIATNSAGKDDSSVQIEINETVSNVSHSIPDIVDFNQGLNFQLISNVSSNFTGSVIYGPKGMQVFSNGRLSWQPDEIMLSDKLRVRFAIAYNNGAGTNIIAHKVELLDANRPNIKAQKTNVPGPRRAVESMFIVDSDEDNNKELLIHSGSSLSAYELQDSEFKDSWVYPFQFFEQGAQDLLIPLSMQSVVVDDYNSDGVQDYFISTDGTNFSSDRSVYLMNGKSKRIIKTITAGENQSGLNFSKVADIDGDGNKELIAFTFMLNETNNNRNHIVVIDVDTDEVEWTSPPIGFLPSTNVNDIFIANVDSDDAFEIITSNGYVFDGVSKEQQWLYDQNFGRYIRTGDILDKGYEQLLVEGSAGIRIFDVMEQSVVEPALPQIGTHFDVGDVIGDGNNYLVINSTAQDATFQPDYSILLYKYVSSSNSFEELGKIPLDGSPFDTTYMLLGNIAGSDAEEVIWQYDGKIRIASFVNNEFVELPDVQKNYAYEASFRNFASRSYRLFNVEEDAPNLMHSYVFSDESYLSRDNYSENYLVSDSSIGDVELQAAYSIDYDQNSTPEILTCSASGLNGSRGSSLVLSSETSGVIWSQQADVYCKSIEFYDVNSDGFKDIIFGGPSILTVYNMHANSLLQEITGTGIQFAHSYFNNGKFSYLGKERFDSVLKRFQLDGQNQLQLITTGTAYPIGTAGNDNDDIFFETDLNGDGHLNILSISNSGRDSDLIVFNSSLQPTTQLAFRLPGQVQDAAFDKFQGENHPRNLIMAIDSNHFGNSVNTTRITSFDVTENEVVWTTENAVIGDFGGSDLYVTDDSRIVFGTTSATFLSY